MDFVNQTALPIKLGTIDAYVFMMKVKHLELIHYVARRGYDNEEGAIQRVLSTVRLRSIENYVIEGNIFYTPFFLNWTNQTDSIHFSGSTIKIPLVEKSAQILDGQHRIAGLSMACKKNPSIGDKEVLVIMTNKLDTQNAAQIFLNINTEQRPVQKSLIYDLFGEINKEALDMPIVRANDIVRFLNENENSPYYQLIKTPGTRRGVGFIDMSTVVSSLKDELKPSGTFSRYNLDGLEIQKMSVYNFFSALRKYYDLEKLWTVKSKNPFLTNAGFVAAIDCFCSILIPKCAEKKSFTIDTIYNVLNLTDYLLTRESIKNQDGKTQRRTVYDYLVTSINKNLPKEHDYSF